MILIILGAQNSFFFLRNYVMAQTKNLHFSTVLQRIHLPDSQKSDSKHIEKTNKIQTPLQVTENRPSSKSFVFVRYLPPKSNDWTPPRDPPRSPQKVPKPTRGAPETPKSSPEALQDPQDALGVTKPAENQQRCKQNNITRLKTTENLWESNETFNNIKLHARIGYFN